jgi:Tol biopolymer transport system component
MVCGQRPFKGHYEQAVTYSILNEDPEPLTALRTAVPMEIEFISGKCLAKDASLRYQSAAELTVDLTSLADRLKSGKSAMLSTARPISVGAVAQKASTAATGDPESDLLVFGWKRYLLWTISAVLALAALMLVGMKIAEPRLPTEGTSFRRFSFTPEGGAIDVSISPNGRYLAYTVGSQNALWVQDLTREEPREITGVTGVRSLCWSPGSDFIGFVTDTELRKVSVDGGPVVTLCALPQFSRDDVETLTWSSDGEAIVFAAGPVSRLYEVSSLGGNPKLLIEPTESQSELWFLQPHFLPSDGAGRQLLYALGNPFTADIVVHDPDTGEHRTLVRGYSPAYSISGHVLFNQEWDDSSTGIWALPFSPGSLQPGEGAFRVSENGHAASSSRDGTLAYIEGSVAAGGLQLFWHDRTGRRLGPAGQPQTDIEYPTLSLDGSQVAVRGREGTSNETNIWLHGAANSTKFRLTFARGHDSHPIWGPTGNEVTYPSDRDGTGYDIRVQPADGGGEERVLVSTPLWEVPDDWSPDGKHLLYHVRDANNLSDLWLLTRDSDGNVAGRAPFLVTPYSESEAQFSPDGRYVAYESDESGRREIYVRRFPDAGRKWLVSSKGGADPRWRADGKELFYVESEILVAVAVNTGDEFSSGAATRLFSDPMLRSPRYHHYDVSRDGQRFVLPSRVESSEVKPPVIRVIQNWYEKFRGREKN